jgi:hypothetical protein
MSGSKYSPRTVDARETISPRSLVVNCSPLGAAGAAPGGGRRRVSRSAQDELGRVSSVTVTVLVDPFRV